MGPYEAEKIAESVVRFNFLPNAQVMRILIVTSESFHGHELRNLPLCAELIGRGHEVIHSGPTTALATEGFRMTAFDPSFAERPEAAECNTRLFSIWSELTDLIDWCQVVLFGVAKQYRHVAAYAAKENKIVLWHRDIGEQNPYVYHADWIAVRGVFEAEVSARRFGVPREHIRVAGCVQFDSAAPKNQRLDRKAFCRKYGLDEDKKIAVFISTAPANHHKMVVENYRNICRIVQNTPGFQLIIKPHPREYAHNKQHCHYEDTETPTWKQLAPGISACEPEDKYDCFRHAEILIDQKSEMFREAVLFHIPILEVNVLEVRAHILNIDADDISRDFPGKRFSPPCRQPWTYFGGLEEIIEELPDSPFKEKAVIDIAKNLDWYSGVLPDFIGAYCSMDELPEILSSGAYRFDDEETYEAYISEYCLTNDGKAHVRVADMVEEAINDPVLAVKLRPPGLLRILKRLLRNWIIRPLRSLRRSSPASN